MSATPADYSLGGHSNLLGDHMKFKFAALVLAASIAASPAHAADFSGPRIGATIGVADDDFGGTEAFTYGINAGYDWDLGKAVIGGTVELQGSDEDGLSRDISIVGRAGAKVTDNALLYALAGYSNLGVDGSDVDLDGFRAGAGVEVALNDHVFGQVEYRYTNYELDAEAHQFVLGIGYRF
jgi:outer membrane immunogenic protein